MRLRKPMLLTHFLFLSTIAVFAAVACSKSSGSSGDTDASDADAASSSSGSSGTTDSDGNVEDPSDPTPRVRYVGRVDNGNAAGPRIGWGGTRVVVRFRGSSVRVKVLERNIDQGPSGYDVIVDGASRAEPFVPADGEGAYDLATDLAADKPHVVELYRRTEAMVAVTQFLGFEFPNGGELLAPPAFPNRRIEFVGDSEATGYGVECGSQNENFTGATENAHKAYPSLVAKALGAEVHNISYSGKGVLRNQDDNAEVYGQIYPRSIPADGAGSWSFASWKPDIVWIALGANDWDLGLAGDRPPPDRDAFKAKYAAFVDLVRSKNPGAQIVCAVQGMLNDVYPPNYSAFTNVKTVVKEVVTERNGAGDAKVQYHEHPRANDAVDLTGCDSHPNAAFHTKVAANVGPKIATIMGW